MLINGTLSDEAWSNGQPNTTNFQIPNFLGVKIANKRGVPGTLGCIAHNIYDDGAVLLSSWHVLFGNGGSDREPVWLVNEDNMARCYVRIGTNILGKVGNQSFGGESYFVDCAIASYSYEDEDTHFTPSFAAGQKLMPIQGYAAVSLGHVVKKVGAATGVTQGVIVDAQYNTRAVVGDRLRPAPRQLLVRSTDSKYVFAAEGDSGAVILNTTNEVVGLLWGANCRGDGVACPIEPVLHALGIALKPSNDLHIHGGT